VAEYVIGDVHGCWQQLAALLKVIDYKPDRDFLFFTGDLINVGPDSLATLRFLVANKDNVLSVLGNHDIVLLGIAAGVLDCPAQARSCNDVLAAKDTRALMEWLHGCPIAHYFDKQDIFLSHAGVHPGWSIQQAISFATEANTARLKDETAFFQNLFGDIPNKWDEQLVGWDRVRFLVNCFTRMRYLNQVDELDFECKVAPNDAPSSLVPWYEHPKCNTANTKLLFGHWSSLRGSTSNQNVYALDTGCVWGGNLTALRISDLHIFRIK